MTRRATAQDVADLAGVSRSAVSLVLNGRAEGNISAIKQEAVREAAQQLRYTPNAVALSLRSKRTATIGVLTWRNRWNMPPVLLGEIYTAASRAGYLLMTVDAVRRPLQVDALLDRRVDGFVILAPELAEFPLPESVASVPTVMVNCFDPSLSASSLIPDEVGAGANAVRHLMASGHRELGVLVGQEGLASERRLHGVCQVAGSAGLPEPAVMAAEHTVGDGYRAALRLLECDRPPSALICTHERLALGALLASKDLGLGVPEDLSVVSLDDGEDLAGSLVPSLDMVERPDATISQHALDLLVDQLQQEHTVPRQLTFVCSVRPGASVSVPRVEALNTG